MMPFLLLLSLLLFNSNCFAGEQIFFKIAVNENSYSSFISDKISIEKTPLSYMASRMREQYFSVNDLDKSFYDISVVQSMTYDEKTVTQYDVKPKNNDRFRQVLIVDTGNGNVIHKDVYDTAGKLVFAFTSLEHGESKKPVSKEPASKENISAVSPAKQVCIRGFCMAGERMLKDGTRHIMLSDGLNKFSIFKKKLDADVPLSKKIIYGNYVLRKKQGDSLYTVVGTIPYNEMEFMIDNYASLEAKQ